VPPTEKIFRPFFGLREFCVGALQHMKRMRMFPSASFMNSEKERSFKGQYFLKCKYKEIKNLQELFQSAVLNRLEDTVTLQNEKKGTVFENVVGRKKKSWVI
jgi:hypothetical protein